MKPVPNSFRRDGPRVLALDLEGTLISNAMSQFPRPGLYQFLERCRELFERVVLFTAVSEGRSRKIAQTLVDEGAAPPWFAQLEHVHWEGETKNLFFIENCTVHDALLVDDLPAYVHPGQESSWVRVDPFASPYPESDSGLIAVSAELEVHARPFKELSA